MRFLALPLFLLALLLPASLLHADGHDETTDARVDRLEKEVALLQAQLKALQAEVQALRAQVAGTQPTEKPDTPARDDVLNVGIDADSKDDDAQHINKALIGQQSRQYDKGERI